MGYYTDVEMGFGFIYPTYPWGSEKILTDLFGEELDDASLTSALEAMGLDQVQVHSVGDSRAEMDFAFLAKGTLKPLTAAAAGNDKPEPSEDAVAQLKTVRKAIMAKRARSVSKIEWLTMESTY